MNAISMIITLNPTTCGECGVAFGLASDFQAARQRDGQTFYCPNGHRRVYRESVEQRLRDQLARETHRAEQAEASATHNRERAYAAERSARAHRAVATRVKNRIAKGVCPCCNRTFANLAAHMTTKHPAFQAEASR